MNKIGQTPTEAEHETGCTSKLVKQTTSQRGKIPINIINKQNRPTDE